MPPRVRFWKPAAPSVAGMLRVDQEDRLRTSCSDHFLVVAVCGGAFDGRYRGRHHTHAAGGLKLKEPGEVFVDLRVHAAFSLQGAAFTPRTVADAGAALGLRAPRFRAAAYGPGALQTQRAFAMHAALTDPQATVLEQESRVAEALAALLSDDDEAPRAPRAVRRARAFLHDALAEKVTLDALSAHAGLDKFHLVRAFHAEVGLPPYAYLTHLRVARARALLMQGGRVADAAQDVGFCDEGQLHRHFRRIVGVSPGRFARAFRGPKSPTTPTSAARRSGTVAQ